MLKKAIEENRIRGAAIDVLIPNRNIIVYSGYGKRNPDPSYRFFTREVFIKMDIAAAQNIIRRFAP